MDVSAVRVRIGDAKARLLSAELQLDGSSPHEWKHAAEIAVSAGIAVSDGCCGHVLGYKVASESHRDAVDALRVASSATTAKHLDSLLAAKSAQSYGDRLPTHSEASRLVLHAKRLVEVAETIIST